MSTASKSNTSNRANDAAEAPTNRSNLPPDGLEVRGVGNLTKEPYVGDKFTALNVAFSRNHKKPDGTFERSEATFAKVILVGEAHRNAPIDQLKKGTKIQAIGPMETESRTDQASGKEFKDLTIKVFNGEDISVLKQPKPKAAGASAQPSTDEPPL